MEVTIECVCPPKADGQPRHEQDTVTLPEHLDFRRTIAIRHRIRLGLSDGPVSLSEVQALLVETYVLYCIDAWTVVDADGNALPVTAATVTDRLMANIIAAEMVGEAADELYTEKVALPLMARASSSSRPTPTPEPTSVTKVGSRTPRPRKGSKPSSISTTPMAVTGPMAASPAGASSSLPS